MEEIVYLNGSFMPLTEAKISVRDYGFLFAYALYETLRTYDGKFFRLDDHIRRLEKSAAVLEIPVDIPMLKEKMIETVRRSGIPDARVRVTVTLGEGSPSPDPSSCHNPTILITAARFTPQPAEVYEKGFRVVVSTLRRSSRSLLPGLKTSSFVESIFARRKARALGADDALLLNENELLAESTFANVFLVIRNVLKTPKLGSGLLPGIARRVVLELARGSGLPYLESVIRPEELEAAEEIFLTNSLIEIMPVTYFEGRPVGSGLPGPVTRKLMAAYKTQVSQELE